MAKVRAGVGGELRGRVGGLVYVLTPNGTVVREMPARRAARTREEILAGERMALAAGVWQGLSPEAMGRWRAYAEGLAATEPALARSPARAWNAFFALAGRIMQVELGARVPTEPPAGFFAGDGVRVAVGPLPLGRRVRREDEREEATQEVVWRSSSGGRGGVEGVAEDGSTPTLPSPSGEGEASGVVFAADRANGAGIVTELLTQPLANAGRTPVGGRYRSRAFVAFESTRLEATVALLPGWHACAVRFVERATGRCTALFPCGVVRVA